MDVNITTEDKKCRKVIPRPEKWKKNVLKAERLVLTALILLLNVK